MGELVNYTFGPSNILHKLPLELGICKAGKKASATGLGRKIDGQCESKTQQKGNGKSRGYLVSNNRARNGATFLIYEGIPDNTLP